MPRRAPILPAVLALIAGLATPLVAAAQPSPAESKAGGKEESSAPLTIENSLSIRDPFRQPVMSGTDNKLLPEIERVDLDKLKVVGIITGPKKSKVMVRAPSGQLYIIEEQTKIGTRRGYIKKILPGMIEIEEKVVNLLGQEESIETVLEYNPDVKAESRKPKEPPPRKEGT